MLQRIRNKIYCFILMICFMTSCICFDAVKADDSMYLFDAANESGQVFTAGEHISNEDVCTSEMLGNTHTRLLSHQTAARNHNETQRKSETLIFLLGDLASLQSPFKFFTSASTNIHTTGTDIAEILHFIHAKDGKKRI